MTYYDPYMTDWSVESGVPQKQVQNSRVAIITKELWKEERDRFSKYCIELCKTKCFSRNVIFNLLYLAIECLLYLKE